MPIPSPWSQPAPQIEQPQGYHFDIVRRAITLICDADRPLSLAQLAQQVGLSPAHFQRVFSDWAGISPKRLQQFLALDHAKHLLATAHSTLDTSLQSGLSGSGRLHDLFITWEGLSPGEYARAARGTTLRHALVQTPLGPMQAIASDKGLCGLAFAADTPQAALTDLMQRWPKADFTPNIEAVAPLVARAFAGQGRLHIRGAPFQIKVWEALLHIPEGAVATYADIARAIDHPNAHRAVGTAVGRNPIAYLIPCHRVLRAGGALGGYHWGLPTKRTLLALEAAKSAPKT
ncbi:Bifunctional transcriptional activator/DNA repair enzyme Ada [Aquimixticola soesokkakensis]|uniref:methylated-DNA--[protein]-cysteine S-methyltransferase n=1 Tax=Aquimixticola soesokkakensis TaxID=1519096 RepID=A0A1Y5SZ26_9RHOB|nr:bifunctional helix-turn-helix domain-containing protein/methylated-DNA--[protein]-cysteine S-methyltransferase [Aquimixticola soesokkakensis]SLN52249.1 Bifunctional transcriptional activator/DNA repair enzyme Ada [Aquimixticola soesokkakensis]